MTKEDQISLDCTIFKQCITLVNIYGPNTDASALPFFESILSNKVNYSTKPKLFHGEFHVVLNTDNDKSGGNAELHLMPRNIILNNIKNFNLTDLLHNLHPKEKQSIYFKLKPRKVLHTLIIS